MTAIRLAITDRSVSMLSAAKSGQQIVRDVDLPGFFLLVGKKSKTFMVQGDLRVQGERTSLRLKIGEVGVIQTREARAKAKILLGSIANGVDPRPKPKIPIISESRFAGPTLREAWESYRIGHMERKHRSNATISSYRDHLERLLLDWLDEPLKTLGDDPSIVKTRHDKLTQKNGPYIANGCMRSLRAIYNHARKTARHLSSENPVNAVDWNPEWRRNTAMGLSDLPQWFAEVAELENPIRRQMHIFMLLSGSRPDVIKCARFGDLSFSKRLLHISKPKGGEDRAFDIPLSREMILCLVRAVRAGRIMYPDQSGSWLFPSDSACGHVVEHKEDRSVLSKWGNDLRQSYRTIAQAAGINSVDMHMLMNHSLPGVNSGYITRNKLLTDHLRKQQQAISTIVFKRIPGNGKCF